MATGEFILCSDQDDVWHSEKLRKFADKFLQSPHPGLIFCDANLVGQNLEPWGKTLWQENGFGAAARRKMVGVTGSSVVLKDPTWFAAGATMGFASKFKSTVLPLPKGWTHDAWIATVIAAVAPVELIDEPLNDYRQHATQVFGGTTGSVGHMMQLAKGRGSTEDHFLATAYRYRLLEGRLRASGMPTHDPALLQKIQGKIAHWECRSKMRKASKLVRFPVIGREYLLGRYQAYSKGWKSMGMDVLY
jgi:hypothetical protein